MFTGGEAFLKENFQKILDVCKGCFIEIYSNGILINLPKNKNLIKTYLSRLTITLDGLKSHNFYRIGSDYKKILENIKEIKISSPRTVIKINTLISTHSIKELLLLYELLKLAKVDEWHIDFPQLRGRLTLLEEPFCADYKEIGRVLGDLLDKYYQDKAPFYLKIYTIFNSKINNSNFIKSDLNENPCSYKTDFSMFINAEGKYILCPSIPYQDITISNVKESSLKEAIELKTKLPFQKIKYSDLNECIKCKYFNLCLGGCRGESKVISDSFLAPDLNSCSLMSIAESMIYPRLPEERKKIYLSKINKDGKSPNLASTLDSLKNESQRKYSVNYQRLLILRLDAPARLLTLSSKFNNIHVFQDMRERNFLIWKLA